ncbi:MAG: hypothetical protein HON94_02355 [Methylococcales bacterium]|jgi:hypothetical protein|nr:hypothetical protein [Methylococcales bacterium]
MNINKQSLESLSNFGIDEKQLKIIHEILEIPCIHLINFNVINHLNTQRLLLGIQHYQQFPGYIESQLENILQKIKHNELIPLIKRLSQIIRTSLKLIKHPINMIGFSVSKDGFKQFKVYYLFENSDEIIENGAVISMKPDKQKIKQSIHQILEDIEFSNDEKNKALNLIDSMYVNTFEFETLGINIEKGKDYALKLYFRPTETDNK